MEISKKIRPYFPCIGEPPNIIAPGSLNVNALHGAGLRDYPFVLLHEGRVWKNGNLPSLPKKDCFVSDSLFCKILILFWCLHVSFSVVQSSAQVFARERSAGGGCHSQANPVLRNVFPRDTWLPDAWSSLGRVECPLLFGPICAIHQNEEIHLTSFPLFWGGGG